MTTNNQSEQELEKLGDKIDPALAEILFEIDKASKLVESDGSSYRHMPDYFKARGKLVKYITQHTEQKVLEGLKDGARRYKESLQTEMISNGDTRVSLHEMDTWHEAWERQLNQLNKLKEK